jgi:hypothetical protein
MGNTITKPAIQSEKSFRTMLTGLCLAVALLGSGCGGGSSTPASGSTTPTTATLVVVMGTGSSASPASVSLDGQVIAEDLTYLSSTNPLIVPSGQHQLLVQNSSGAFGSSPTNPFVALDLQPASQTTVVYFTPAVFGVDVEPFTGDTTPAPNSMAKLRIADTSFTTEPLQVFIVPFGSGPTGSPQIPIFGQGNPTYQTFSPGNYDIYFVTAPYSGGPPPTIRYHTGSLMLGANQNRSVYFLTACPEPPMACNTEGTYATVTVPDLN